MSSPHQSASDNGSGHANSSSSSVEYQAVILATAIGSSLFPLTSEDGGIEAQAGEAIGRSVLPLATRPILWYQLDMIHKAGFPDVIVVTRESMKKVVGRVVEEWRSARAQGAQADLTVGATPAPMLNIDLVALDRYLGSADALRRIAPRIHTDFFVLGGDLVSNLPFQNLADLARAQDAGLVMAVSEEPEVALDAKERKKVEAEAAAAGVDAQYFGIDAESQRLLLFKSQADVEEKLEVSKRLLAKHPRFTLHTRIRDAHLYLFSQWVLYFLIAKPTIVSIQSELIPCLVAGQYKAKYAEWRNYGKNSAQKLALRMSHAPSKDSTDSLDSASDLGQPLLNRGLSSLDASGNSLASMVGSSSMTDMSGVAASSSAAAGGSFQESFRLFVYQASANTFCMRANTLSAYKNLNHELCSDRVYAYQPWPVLAADNHAERLGKQFSSSVAIGRETIVGEGTTFSGEQTTIKRSCVGRACNIAARVKLQGCIVMDGVTIAEGCTLTDCLISSGAVIGANSVLKDCKIGAKFTVAPGTEGKGETMCNDDEE